MIERTMTLGEIIEKLEQCDQTKSTGYDFCGMCIDGIHSWRGNYADLAIGFSEPTGASGNRMTVSQVLQMFKEAVGKTYEGYKGGKFIMDLNTEVWVDNYGRFTETGLKDIVESEYTVTFITAPTEY